MDLYAEIIALLKGGERFALATIVSSRGSTPVPPGAKMLVRIGTATSLGTIGGGAVEAEVQEEAKKLLEAGDVSRIRSFTLSEENIESGMLCGGSIDVLIEALSKDELPVYSALTSKRESGQDVTLVVHIGENLVKQAKFLVTPGAREEEGTQQVNDALGSHAQSLMESVTASLTRQTVVRLPLETGEMIIEPVVGVQDVVIFGGGHVAKYVARSAALAGFRVTVVDDRPEYANPQRFPEASRTLAVGFDAAWDQLRIAPSTSIVIVTRGHTFDELVLERAVRTSARYIGMIGSVRKVTTTFGNLIQRGIPPELLEKVHSPIGLDIGAVTAEEIGISITAELVAVRRGVDSPGASMSRRFARGLRMKPEGRA